MSGDMAAEIDGDHHGARERRFRARDGLMLSALDWAGEPSRTPLLCLPGITRTALDYAALARRHAGRRRVVALDYAGHGGSERAASVSRYSPQAAVADILDGCAALGVHHAVICGTSFGGLMAMFLALIRPALLRGVVLNDVGPRLESAGLDGVRAFTGTDPGFATLAEAVPYLKRTMPGMALPDDAAWTRFADRTFAPGADGRLHPRWDTRLAELLGRGGPAGDFGPVFAGLGELPVMLVWGEESDILSAGTVADMRAQKPDLELLVVPGVGHAPTLEEPVAMARLDRFLEGIR